MAAQGYLGSGGAPHVRWVQTIFTSGWSNVAVCVSVILALLFLSTRMPPADVTDFGQPKSIIQRTMSYMWIHMSPTMPFPYSMKARQVRGCTSLLYGRIGAGPVHMS